MAEIAPSGSALAQLQERDFVAKYRGRGKPIRRQRSVPDDAGALRPEDGQRYAIYSR